VLKELGTSGPEASREKGRGRHTRGHVSPPHGNGEGWRRLSRGRSDEIHLGARGGGGGVDL